MTEANLSGGRILIIDDHEANVRLLEYILEANGLRNVRSTTDPREACAVCAEFQPDLILLDLHMPYLDGFAVLRQLMPHIKEHGYLPVLVLSADVTPDSKQKALSMGAKDFLNKPFDYVEVVLRVNNLLQTRLLYLRLQNYNEGLEKRVQERTQQLVEAQIEILHRLAAAAEYRDDATGEHTRRVGSLACRLALALGKSEAEADRLRLAAALHDLGKIGIPDQILLKHGSYTSEEFEVMKSHTTIGGEILGSSNLPVLQLARQIALSHHERWDGSGYPLGLAGERIPVEGRIVAIADVFDALTHERPYKRAWSFEDAVAEIRNLSGRQLDPQLVEVFLSMLNTGGLSRFSTQVQDEAETSGIIPAPGTEALK